MSFSLMDAAAVNLGLVREYVLQLEKVTKINGSMHAEGPSVFGNPMNFPGLCHSYWGTTNDDPANAKNLIPTLGIPVCIKVLPH